MGEIAAVILAGGRAERLGGATKAAIEVGGIRLLDRVLARVARCSPIVVAHGPHDPASWALPPGLIGVCDLGGGYAGPLAGLAAAVAALPHTVDLLICAAVDSPFLPVDYVDRLMTGLGDGDAAIASYRGQPYPTNSLWRVPKFRGLPHDVMAGQAPKSLRSLGAAANAVVVEWPEMPDGDPFANVNTPEDLAMANARAARRQGAF